MAFACPDQDQNGSVNDHEIHQYVEELRYLSNGFQRNKIIEKCYLKHNDKLNFNQVEILLNALYDENATNTYDKEEAQDRVTKNYFGLIINSSRVNLVIRVARNSLMGLTEISILKSIFRQIVTNLRGKKLKHY